MKPLSCKIAVIRLGKKSVADIMTINATSGPQDPPLLFDIDCKQVPEDLDVDDYVLFWLGSDNNKGSPTSWDQGCRALGKVMSKKGGPGYNDPWTVSVAVTVVWPQSMHHLDFLRASSAAFYHMADVPVLGLRSQSNQTVQLIGDGDHKDVRAIFYALSMAYPETREWVTAKHADLALRYDYVPPAPPSVGGGVGKKGAETTPVLDKDDAIAAKVEQLVSAGHRAILFLGPPGTGKTRYAHAIAQQMSSEPDKQVRLTQFHPTYSYDDFVEGYVPIAQKSDDGRTTTASFQLRDKVLLQLSEVARNNADRLYFLVIDELNRGDPARVFGEALTYVEAEYRGREFHLPFSNRLTNLPPNLVILATMNPFDRSISDFDAALDRRFYKIAIDPDADILQTILIKNGVAKGVVEGVVAFFAFVQPTLSRGGLGHGFFAATKDLDDLLDLWNHQLRFFFAKEYADNKDSLENARNKYSTIDGVEESKLH